MTATRETATTRRRDEESGVLEVRLPNGLLALIAERRRAPVVSVQTWYRVGSREEDKGRTGLAHFLEHLMFKGTQTLRRGDIDRVTMRNGGSNNADTTVDRTRYYFTFASDRWERALEIEADRMRGSTFDEHEFQLERGPVIEELRRDRDDPWWALHEVVEATAYQVHPYRNPVIGWPEEIVKVPREDVLAFYERWYQPWNCTLVVVGDIDADRAADRIIELFGEIPSSEPPVHFVPEEPAQEGERRFELLMDVTIPRLMVSYHGVRVRDPEDTELDVLQVVLTGGKSGRLYDRLVRREGLVTGVSAGNDSRRDTGLFTISTELTENSAPADVERALFDELDRVVSDGPTDAEFERACALIRSGRRFRHETAAGTADVIGTMQVLAGDHRLLAAQARRLDELTPADVQRVAARVLQRRNRTVGWLLPRPEGAPARPPIPEGGHEDPGAPEDETRPAPAVVTTLPTGRPTLRLDATRHQLDNGLRVVVLPRHDVDTIAVRAFVRGGRLHERKPGQAAWTGTCLDEGAGGRDGAEIARLFADRGAHFTAGAGGFSLRCMIADTDALLPVACEVLRAPEFPAEAIERKRRELFAAIAAEDESAAGIAVRRLMLELYGQHPLARRDKGGTEELASLSREDLVAHHHALFVPENAIVAVVGDLGTDEALALVERRLGDWASRPASREPVTPPPERVPVQTIHLPEDRDQTHVALGHMGIRRADPDFPALVLSDNVLGVGPGFTNRLSRSIRDEQGLAYSVWAHISRSADLEPGLFRAYVGTSPALRERATVGILDEIRRFVGDSPATDEEIEDARRYVVGSHVFGFETNADAADQLVGIERLGLPLDYPERFIEAIESTSADEVRAAAQRHIDPDALVTVWVGRDE